MNKTILSTLLLLFASICVNAQLFNTADGCAGNSSSVSLVIENASEIKNCYIDYSFSETEMEFVEASSYNFPSEDILIDPGYNGVSINLLDISDQTTADKIYLSLKFNLLSPVDSITNMADIVLTYIDGTVESLNDIKSSLILSNPDVSIAPIAQYDNTKEWYIVKATPTNYTSYTWGTLGEPLGETHEHGFTEEGLYKVTVTDEYGCIGSAEQWVTTNNEEETQGASYQFDTAEGCAYQTIQVPLKLTDLSGLKDCYISYGNNEISMQLEDITCNGYPQESLVIDPGANGFSLNLMDIDTKATSNEILLSFDVKYNNTVDSIFNTAKISFQYLDDTMEVKENISSLVKQHNPTINIEPEAVYNEEIDWYIVNAYPTNYTSYTWGTLGEPLGEAYEHGFTEEGLYVVTITDQYGCTASNEQMVKLPDTTEPTKAEVNFMPSQGCAGITQTVSLNITNSDLIKAAYLYFDYDSEIVTFKSSDSEGFPTDKVLIDPYGSGVFIGLIDIEEYATSENTLLNINLETSAQTDSIFNSASVILDYIDGTREEINSLNWVMQLTHPTINIEPKAAYNEEIDWYIVKATPTNYTSYTWGTLGEPLGEGYEHGFTEEGLYEVTVTDEYGCIGSAEQWVTSNNEEEIQGASYQFDTAEGCAYQTIQVPLKLTDLSGLTYCSISYGNNEISMQLEDITCNGYPQESLVIDPGANGFSLNLMDIDTKATSNEILLSLNVKYNNSVDSIFNTAKISFQYLDDTMEVKENISSLVKQHNPTINIEPEAVYNEEIDWYIVNAYPTNYTSYTWGTLGEPLGEAYEHGFTEEGLYVVTITDQYGCTASNEQMVKLPDTTEPTKAEVNFMPSQGCAGITQTVSLNITNSDLIKAAYLYFDYDSEIVTFKSSDSNGFPTDKVLIDPYGSGVFIGLIDIEEYATSENTLLNINLETSAQTDSIFNSASVILDYIDGTREEINSLNWIMQLTHPKVTLTTKPSYDDRFDKYVVIASPTSYEKYEWKGNGESVTNPYLRAFTEEGLYEVTISDQSGCIGSAKEWVSNPDDYNQYAYAKGTVLNTSGQALTETTVQAIDSKDYEQIYYSEVTDGNFTFERIPKGDYIFYAVPSNDSKYLPCYYGNQEHWANAFTINLNEAEGVIDINITPKEVQSVSGNIKVHGNISRSNTKSISDIINNGIPLLITDINNNPITWTTSDAAGNYELLLPHGKYFIYPEYAGFNMNYTELSLGINDKEVVVNFQLNNSEISTEINYTKQGSNISFYPNPSKGMIRINGDASNYEIKIVNQAGKTVYLKATSDKQINISSLSPGIYFISINGVTSKLCIIK